MPFVTISILKDKSTDYIQAVADGINAAVIETIEFPNDDRYQVIHQLDPACLPLQHTRGRPGHDAPGDSRRTLEQVQAGVLQESCGESGQKSGHTAEKRADHDHRKPRYRLVVQGRHRSVCGLEHPTAPALAGTVRSKTTRRVRGCDRYASAVSGDSWRRHARVVSLPVRNVMASLACLQATAGFVSKVSVLSV